MTPPHALFINEPPTASRNRAHELPIYRVLTGSDHANFCRRVSAALEMGYQLHGAPTLAFNDKDKDMILVQTVIWPDSAATQVN